MPTYEYVCPHCGHEFELVQKMTDPPLQECPKCGKSVKRKLGKGAGFIFKGSGFYATDYRSPDYKAKEKAEKGAPPEKSGEGKPKESGAAGTPSSGSGAGGGSGGGSSGGDSASTSPSSSAGSEKRGSGGTKPASP